MTTLRLISTRVAMGQAARPPPSPHIMVRADVLPFHHDDHCARQRRASNHPHARCYMDIDISIRIRKNSHAERLGPITQDQKLSTARLRALT